MHQLSTRFDWGILVRSFSTCSPYSLWLFFLRKRRILDGFFFQWKVLSYCFLRPVVSPWHFLLFLFRIVDCLYLRFYLFVYPVYLRVIHVLGHSCEFGKGANHQLSCFFGLSLPRFYRFHRLYTTGLVFSLCPCCPPPPRIFRFIHLFCSIFCFRLNLYSSFLSFLLYTYDYHFDRTYVWWTWDSASLLGAWRALWRGPSSSLVCARFGTVAHGCDITFSPLFIFHTLTLLNDHVVEQVL